MLRPMPIYPAPAPPARASLARAAVLLATAAAAICTPLALVITASPSRRALPAKLVLPKPQVVPPSQMPVVDAPRFAPVTRADAVAYNATIPFSRDPNPAARPFRLVAAPDAVARAVDCLAAATLYEAGDDVAGEQAVAQVVLNRVRHPAFPKSICAVVFEGAERSTGCQFTFTCDGALVRTRFGAAAWERARLVARAALSGTVFKPVGHATHYHTNWVVPYWSASLDKVASVGTHLFFRWSGWWGTPPAFTRQVANSEPIVDQLAALSLAHRSDDAAIITAGGTPSGPPDAALRRYPEVAGTPDTFIVIVAPEVAADDLPALALLNCGERAYCKFMAWNNAAKAPKALPLSQAEMAAMSFSYFRNRATNYDKPLWNCAVFQRPIPQQCMRRLPLAADTTSADGRINARALPDSAPLPTPRPGSVLTAPRPAPAPPPTVP